ncbi:MAG: galactofuranosylgalactofuranosylrhamnosyl-N-acetylglucosaminyl-diphospho-decaprenol [Nocardioidaceae bacterium]|nr:galactofuranosylgalactofuranosylrhamnosyl-N-acetylglucosaminyl-diphospho-decaprenol [Nocardioidaceae bacterium]
MTDTARPPVLETGDDIDPLVGHRVVQRTILRADQELDIRPLYVSGLSNFSTGESTSRQSGSSDEEGSAETPSAELEESTAQSDETMSGYGSISGTVGAVVMPERRLTFGTYFNAFPASYWRRWTDLASVRLVMRVSGSGTVIVYRSTSKGHVQRADSALVGSDELQTIVFDLPLKPFIDGGWYWFDLEAGEGSLSLEEAVWAFETDRQVSGRLSIGITTFNRPEFCVDQLVTLSEQPAILTALDEILVIDQGTAKVADHELYPQVAATLGPKLRLIEQGNLGGSGGFSRAMDESASKGDADYVLLLDDDVVCEPEGILRAVAFADLAKSPTIVGGQMFSLYDRSVLHAYGETVAKYRWFWGAAPNTVHGHNFAKKSLRSTQWLHRRIDVDYNGWWMCLIPTAVIREIGLSLPMFIKWDDAEFGLRAREAGYPTVTLPGVAVWHVPWHEKDDTIDWQAYFHRRNRIVAALLHSPYERGGRLVLESFETQVKHLLSMQYGPAEMGLMAIEDILEGPQRMHRDVLNRLPELRELRKRFDDSRSQSDLDAFPSPRRRKPPRRGKEPTAPTGRLARGKTMVAGALRQVLPVRDMARHNPEANVPHVDLKWWLLSQFDSALVSSADGTEASWYKRDRDLFASLMKRSIALHARLTAEWPQLVEQYKTALPELASPESWHETFATSEQRS